MTHVNNSRIFRKWRLPENEREQQGIADMGTEAAGDRTPGRKPAFCGMHRPTGPRLMLIAVLARLVAAHGHSAYLRSDNGPDSVAHQVQTWLTVHRAATLSIDPGCPWQHGFGEVSTGPCGMNASIWTPFLCFHGRGAPSVPLSARLIHIFSREEAGFLGDYSAFFSHRRNAAEIAPYLDSCGVTIHSVAL